MKVSAIKTYQRHCPNSAAIPGQSISLEWITLEFALRIQVMTRRVMTVFVLLLSLKPAVSAENITLDDYVGAYIDIFESGSVNGTKFQVTDTLEIRRLGADTVEFEMFLNFFNLHSCNISGLAKMEENFLVYRNKNEDGEECILKMILAEGEIKFEDVGSYCREGTCGSRGGYGSAYFPLSSKKEISASKEK